MNNKKAYVVAVDMGYGHQRAAYPLLKFAAAPLGWDNSNQIISANDYPNMPNSDKLIWEGKRKTYEWFSRMNDLPIFGKAIFGIMNHFQKIEPFYPKRMLKKPSTQVKRVYELIKNGFGKHLIETLNENPLPLICTFFYPAFFADEHGYKGEIYLLCTDTDISRAWVPLHPEKSKITYLAPTIRAKERLERYGVKSEKIIITGFPLPETLSEKLLKIVFAKRIIRLDPRGIFRKKFAPLLTNYVGDNLEETNSFFQDPLTITFAVGGAGAQSEIGEKILKSASPLIKEGKLILNLVAGTSKHVRNDYSELAENLGLTKYANKGISIIYNENKFKYFKEFDKIVYETDILWTKPSELSFYAGFGLPIIMTPPLGSQESFNESWLKHIGAGVNQNNPKFANEWIPDWLKSGTLAQAAINGYIKIPRNAVERIEGVVFNKERLWTDDVFFQ